MSSRQNVETSLEYAASTPLPRIKQGPGTFTAERLSHILQTEKFGKGPTRKPWKDPAYEEISRPKAEVTRDCFRFRAANDHTNTSEYRSPDEARESAMDFCRRLFVASASQVSLEPQVLDAAFTHCWNFQFEPLDQSGPIVEQASAILERMPAWAPELTDIPEQLPEEYENPPRKDVKNISKSLSLWQRLRVTNYVSNVNLRFLLCAVIEGSAFLGRLQAVANAVAALLEIVSSCELSGEDASSLPWIPFILRAYLWTIWQRCQLIYFYIGSRLDVEFGTRFGSFAADLRMTTPSPNQTIEEYSRLHASKGKAAYMCGWNFELLRTNLTCIGADFRQFHAMYRHTFTNRPGRCFQNRAHSCSGGSSDDCQRFHGMTIEDQSQHDLGCFRTCTRLKWSESSYRAIKGGRAVAVTDQVDTATNQITYCNTSDRTLAITHVWSQCGLCEKLTKTSGQGGRPETGLNFCLHQRYWRLSRSQNCDSYWIDALCIPTGHDLRSEAIKHINATFMKAGVVLICDKDIMEIDASNLSVLTCQTLLISLIVSDWNTRAWTCLEAFRGRRNIHLLCKHNTIVALRQIKDIVYKQGAVDVAILLLAIPHILAPRDNRLLDPGVTRRAVRGLDSPPSYLSLRSSNLLLSHRPASRPGDDIVIWSLLVSEETVFSNPAEFWRSLQGPISLRNDQSVKYARLVELGILISDAPRVQVKGLGWAPASPTVSSSMDPFMERTRRTQIGKSCTGHITPHGLVADWDVFRFPVQASGAPASKLPSLNIRRIETRFLSGYRWGILMRVTEESFSRQDWWEPEFGGNSRKFLVVCGSNDPQGLVAERWAFGKINNTITELVENIKAIGWHWRGVCQWDPAEDLPQFVRSNRLLVV